MAGVDRTRGAEPHRTSHLHELAALEEGDPSPRVGPPRTGDAAVERHRADRRRPLRRPMSTGRTVLAGVLSLALFALGAGAGTGGRDRDGSRPGIPGGGPPRPSPEPMRSGAPIEVRLWKWGKDAASRADFLAIEDGAR